MEYKIYVVYIGSVSFVALSTSFLLDVHSSCRPQIAGLIAKKAFTKVPDKYIDFVDVFSPDLTSKLLKHTRINDHTIKLVDGQQPSYAPIYSLRLVELEILKVYIDTNLANKFIKSFNSPAGALILFDQKLDGFL